MRKLIISLVLAVTVISPAPMLAEYLSVNGNLNPRPILGNPVDWTGKIFADGLTIHFGNTANYIPVIGSDGKLVLSIIPALPGTIITSGTINKDRLPGTLNQTTFIGTGVSSPYFNNVIITAPASAATLTLGSGTTTTINGGGIFNLAGHTVTAPSDGTLVYQSRTLTAGAGLTGGGDLSNDKTFNVGAGSGITVNADDIALTTPGQLSASSTNTSAGSHTHAITTSSNPGANAVILASNSSGQLTLVDLLANATTFNLVNTTATTLNFAGAATTFNLGAATGTATLNNATVAFGGTLLNPVTSYNTDVGQLSKKFKAIYASELWVETLVAQNTIATIGGRLLIGPTTSLIADLSTGATTMDVKHNQMSNGDRVYLEANGSVEFIGITSGPSTITGGYRYTITRNLDGTGANAWSAGDAVFNTGTTGNGFIDLYSVQAVKGGSQLGPTIVGNVRNSSTYNDWSEVWALGNLVGTYGYGSTTYGAGLGKYASGLGNITIDTTNGIRMRNYTTTLGQWYPSGQIDIGEDAAGKSYITIDQTHGVRLANGADVRLQLQMDGSGFLANSHIAWDTSGNITIDGNATIAGWAVNSTYFAKDTGTNSTSAGMAPLDYPFFAGSTYANRATAPFRVTPAGALTATSATITGTITASSGSITGPLTMSGTTSSIAIGTTPPTSATAGTGIWLDRTGLYLLSSNTQNVVLDANGVTAGGGDVKLNSAGFTINVTSSYSASKALRYQLSGVDVAALYGTGTGTDSGAVLRAIRPNGNTNALISLEALSANSLYSTLIRLHDDNGAGSVNIGSAGLSTFSGVVIGHYLATPNHMLDIYGTGWFQSNLTVGDGNLTAGTGGTGTTLRQLILNGGSGTGGGSQISLQSNGVTGAALGLENSIVGSGSNTKLTLYSSNTTFRLYGLGAGTLSTDASGNVTASSDESLKIIEGTFDRGMADLRGLKPKKGHWNAASNLDPTEQYVWLTAQDLLPHIPEAVFLGSNGKYTVDREPILDTVVNALNEIDARLSKLEGAAGISTKADTTDRKKLVTDRLAGLKTRLEKREAEDEKSRKLNSIPSTPMPTAMPRAR